MEFIKNEPTESGEYLVIMTGYALHPIKQKSRTIANYNKDAKNGYEKWFIGGSYITVSHYAIMPDITP